MKNILDYYYQIIVDDKDIDNKGYFSYNSHHFCLYEYKRNISESEALASLNQIMISNNVSINKIINNIFNQVITFHNNKYYVLILVLYQFTDNGNIRFIETYNNPKLTILKRNEWSRLWSIKIDYIEYQLMHIKNKYPIINNSVNYYIGLAENAIAYFNMLNLSNIPLYLAHRRITKGNIYNPVELVIDYKVRDLAEYIKWEFFYNNKMIIEIENIINKVSLDSIDYLLLYIRLLYPSYYFDLYDQVINNNVSEDKLNSIIKLSSLYEKLLNRVYFIIKNKTNIISIPWLNSHSV